MNKTTEALKLAEEALNAMLTHMGMDEDEWTKPTFNQAREALAAIREALAEPVKPSQLADASLEPVAWVDAKEEGHEFYGISYLPVGKHHLYAAPVSAKREWVDLTDDEILKAIRGIDGGFEGFRALIAAFKEKNK